MARSTAKQRACSRFRTIRKPSTYRFIIVAAKRARQLQNGARSFLPTTSKKPTITSMEEVRRGLVKYDDPMRDAPTRA